MSNNGCVRHRCASACTDGCVCVCMYKEELEHTILWDTDTSSAETGDAFPDSLQGITVLHPESQQVVGTFTTHLEGTGHICELHLVAFPCPGTD